MTNAIVTQEQKTESKTPSDMIRYALDKGANLDQIEKLLIIQERWDANEAKKAYYSAMAQFKANPPKIEKDRAVSFGAGKAAYKHASLYQVTQKIAQELSKWGLSASWRVAQNGQISVTTRISHKLGHFEETTLTAPADTSGSKNSIQAVGSTVTYLERYGLLALTGLATADQDDDALSHDIEYIDQKQLSQIIDMIADRQVDESKFLKYMQIESLDKMPKAKFQQAMTAIEQKKRAAK